MMCASLVAFDVFFFLLIKYLNQIHLDELIFILILNLFGYNYWVGDSFQAVTGIRVMLYCGPFACSVQ